MFQCETFIEDYEDEIIGIYKESSELSDAESIRKLCTDSAGKINYDLYFNEEF